MKLLSSLLNLFRRPSSATGPQDAHMTFGSTSIGRTVSRTGMFLKKRIWLFPIIAVAVLAIIGWGMRRAIETTMKDNLRSQLQTLLHVETAMLETWLRIQVTNGESMANAAQTRELIQQLVTEVDPTHPLPKPLRLSAVHRELAKSLAPAMSSYDYHSYLLADKSLKILSASSEELIGLDAYPEQEPFLALALLGETIISPPFSSSS